MIIKIIQLTIPLLLAGTGLLQTILYFKLKKTFERWPTVAAEVTHSVLLNQLDADGRDILEGIINFKYTFRGKEYEVDTPALRSYDLFPSLEYERSLTRRYRVGDIVNARVHPNAPSLAYLEVAPFSRASAILSPIMTLLGIALLFGYFYGYWALFTFFA